MLHIQVYETSVQNALDTTGPMTCDAQPKHCPADALYIVTSLCTSNATLLNAAENETSSMATGQHLVTPGLSLGPTVKTSENVASAMVGVHSPLAFSVPAGQDATQAAPVLSTTGVAPEHVAHAPVD